MTAHCKEHAPNAQPDAGSPRWFGALEHPWATRVVLLLAMLVASSSIGVRFCTDDHSFRAAIAGARRPSYDLFRFSADTAAGNEQLIAIGRLPWWTAPDLKIHFFRPLTSLLFVLDVRLFGDAPLGYHLESLAWYLALLVSVAALFRRTLPKATATLALFVFAMRGAHVLPYAWISARHVLVGAVPATLALLAHVRASQQTWRIGAYLAPALLIVALFGSEAALAIVPFWIAYDVVRARATGAWGHALVRTLPAMTASSLYLVAYHLLGCGARASGAYHDPIASPGTVLRLALTRVPMLLADALLGFPIAATAVVPTSTIVVIGLVGVTMCAFLSRACALPESQRASLAWLIPGGLLAMAIGLSGLPSGRVLVIPDLGFAALLAVLIHRGLAAKRAPRGARTAMIAGAGLLAVVHIILAPLGALREIERFARLARASERIARTAEIGQDDRMRVMVIAASDPFVFLYPRGILADVAPGKVRCWSVLSASRAAHRLTRSGPRSFALEPIDRTLLQDFDVLFRAPDHPIDAGTEVRQCGMTIHVDTVDAGRPTKITITSDSRLDREDLAWLVWRDGALVRFALPSVGESSEIPYAPGPSRL